MTSRQPKEEVLLQALEAHLYASHGLKLVRFVRSEHADLKSVATQVAAAKVMFGMHGGAMSVRFTFHPHF